MGSRIELQAKLEELLGSSNVYFQPPETVKIKYPCIIYEIDRLNSMFADNVRYTSMKGYLITVIDKNPDSLIPDAIANLPLCSFDRRYTTDNLNHTTFTIYF